ncbi:VOC family protein [Albibacterium profundi]|uniref:VOC family protein n=1 Tax=Albibacterium profundi TaxID=3134906 RepID=A0ABV5CDF8_9SPHI
METKILGLRTTIYRVADIQAATEWYIKAFETQPYFSESFYVGFEIGGYELGLQPEVDPEKDKTDNVVAYWGVNDIHAEFDRFLGLGATAHEKPKEVGGGIMVAILKDLWGNAIGLIYNPHFT